MLVDDELLERKIQLFSMVSRKVMACTSAPHLGPVQ
jgi:hypothetical protein